MKKTNKKKLIIIPLILIFLIGVTVLLFIYFSPKEENEYPTEPIIQESLIGGDNTRIDVKSLEEDEPVDYKLWEISNKISLEEINLMISQVNPSLELTQQDEGVYYYWTDNKGSSFQYSLLRNQLVFTLEEGISWNEVELTGDSFSLFVRRYFDKGWEYRLNSKVVYPDGSTIYYANRKLPDGLLLETSDLYNETDYLTLQNGKIVSGRILLTEFIDTEKYVPVLNFKELSKYINLSDYPKSLYFNQGKLATILSIEDEYLNDEILELQKEITDCRATGNKTVYLYKSFSQELLTPVFKLDLECSLEYQNSEYSVPSVAYVNAIDPNYVVAQ
jgi:hypothetical protein